MNNVTPEQKVAVIALVAAVADTIRELGSVPSGHLYARLMGTLSLRDYEAIIRSLKNAGLVREQHHELTWIGPKENV